MPSNGSDCPVNKIDSNVVGLTYAEEKCIGVLPDGAVAGDQEGGVWRPLDPNEFNDFGAETSMVARNPISASRQNKKGTVTDLEASGGFNQDMTQSALTRMMQGFFFADARERVSTAPISDLPEPLVTITATTATTIVVGTGGGAKFKAGDILKLSGFNNSANNKGNIVITSISANTLTVDASLVAEVATSQSKLEVVGYRFDEAEASIVFAAGELLTFERVTGDFTTEDYNVGEWIYISQDDAGTDGFVNNGGYARIEKIEALRLTLREPTWTPVSEGASSGNETRIYLGTFIRNENDPSLIKRRSYQLERTLGQDNDGTQSEYLTGSVADEFTMNLSTGDKITCDLSFMSLTNELRSGTEGLKAGDRSQTLVVEDAYNTSSDVYQLRLFVDDPTKATPSSLYSKVMEGSITIANNASGNKAIGTFGSFDITVGDFEVSGDIEAYFSTIEAVKAVKQNADVGFNMIATKDNAGFVYDIPLLSLGGGRVTVEPDEPIKLPVEQSGAENDMGFTLGATYFNYLPDEAMADIE